MNFKIGDTVEYQANEYPGVQRGARAVIKGYIVPGTIGPDGYLDIEWIKNTPVGAYWKGQPDGSYPSKFFIQVAPLVHLFNITINAAELMNQIRMRGEWDVRKEIHTALDMLVENVKSNPNGPPRLSPPVSDIQPPNAPV